MHETLSTSFVLKLAWGSNAQGELGDGTYVSRNTPVQIGSGYASIAVGGNHSLALKKTVHFGHGGIINLVN